MVLIITSKELQNLHTILLKFILHLLTEFPNFSMCFNLDC